jgi:hypothetical protein
MLGNGRANKNYQKAPSRMGGSGWYSAGDSRGAHLMNAIVDQADDRKMDAHLLARAPMHLSALP